MSVLAMPLQLGKGPGRIEDAEALVRKVAEDTLRKWGARLDSNQREDLVSYLIGVAWELSGRYDPAKDKKPNLGAYVSRIVSLRVADWYRQTFGDTRHGERPVVLSLDAPASLGGVGAETEGGDRLVDTLAASTGDPSVDSAPDLVRVLNGRGGGGPGPHAAVGEQTARRAAGRARSSTGGPKRGKHHPRIPGTTRAPSRPPVCSSCYPTFRSAFEQVNKKVAPAARLTPDQLDAKAAKRARAIRFGKEWACPRCTKLEDEKGQQMLLTEAYPNRGARRQAAKAAGLHKTTKPKKSAKKPAAKAA